MFVMSPRRVASRLATALIVATPALVQAQNANAGWDAQQILRTESFVKPPENLVRIITTPRVDISFTNASPDHRWFLRATGSDRGDIKAYGAPHVWLGGVQVDTRANRARSLTTSNRNGLTLVDPTTGTTRAISVPAGASISSPVTRSWLGFSVMPSWVASASQTAWSPRARTSSMIVVMEL